MSNQIVPFNFEDNTIRVVTVDGEPMFVAKDVTDALGLGNGRDAVSRLDQDGVGNADIIDRLGRTQTVAVLQESALYEIIFQSRVPGALGFKKWVTGEVLPSIRKTGSYGQPKSLEERSLELIGDLNAKVIEQAQQLEAQQPLVDQALTYQGGVNLTTRQEFAREIITWGSKQGFDIKQSDVFKFLTIKLKLFVGGNRSDTGLATMDAIRRGFAVTEKGTAPNGHNYATGKLTVEGKAYAWERATRYLNTEGTLRLPVKAVA